MLILLSTFLGQPLTILGELVPSESFSQASGIIPLVKVSLFITGFQDGRE